MIDDLHVCRYANGGHPAGLHTTALGAGPEVYNNMEASHNCVGGSEQGCIPDKPPVGDGTAAFRPLLAHAAPCRADARCEQL